MATWQGQKAGGTHTTVIDGGMQFVRAAEKLPQVKKISLGFIKPVSKTGKKKTKFDPIHGGWRVTLRTNAGVQKIYIYTPEPEQVRILLQW